MNELDNPFEKVHEVKGTKIYFKRQKWVRELKEKYSHCCICGSRENLTVHHVIQVPNYERLYYNTDNGVVICQKCHNEYHRRYKRINPTTLLQFKEEEVLR